MPDTKITALTAIGANPIIPSTFPIPMVDLTDTSMAASGTTKKVTVNQILGAGGTATLASATITGDLTVRTNKLFVNATGVGVGTTSLFGDLNIQNGSNCRFELGSAAGGTVIENLNNARNAYLNMTMYADAYIWNRLGSEVMRLNSTGLGVGASPVEKLTIAGRGLFATANPDNAAIKLEASTGTNAVAINFRNTGGNYFVGVDNSAGGRLFGVPYSLCVGSEGAYPVVIATNNIARLTVDTAGNVGIGVTPSTRLHVKGGLPVFRLDNSSTGLNQFDTGVDSLGAYFRTYVVDGIRWYNAAGGIPMTLDASGNLLVGTTSSLPSFANGRIEVLSEASSYCMVADATATSAAGIGVRGNDSTVAASFYNASTGGTVGSIVINSGGVSYNTTSDYRLKESIKPISGGLARVNALKPSIYNWKSNGSSGEGFLAHELAEVVPFAVTGEKDAVNEDGSIKAQSIDMSRVVPILVAAIQELTAEVNALKNA